MYNNTILNIISPRESGRSRSRRRWTSLCIKRICVSGGEALPLMLSGALPLLESPL